MSVDPFTYEVLRHRLANLTAEGAIALQRVSGSPLATEAFDMNTSIMSARGDVVFAGPYLLTGPMGQGLIVRRILADPGAGTRLEPGDRFICNDPYAGSVHQNCVTLVAPLFADGSLIAWAGATLHVVDVGGASVGQVGIGARSILDEAPTMAPTRIVQAGRIVADVEAEYLGRSRTPELNALDLRAKIAALNAIESGMTAMVREHGAETVVGVLDGTLERATDHFRRRIAELPDGEARETAFVEEDLGEGRIRHRAIRVTLRRVEDRLVLDFSDSSDQAAAVVNATRSGLLSGVLIGLLTTLVWDAPWCPAAIERSITVVSRPGSVVDATWPAGCSMATMAAGFAATTVTAVAVGDLLARDPGLRERAMAAWAGAVGSVDVFGTDAVGRPFGTVLLDTMASGTGATAGGDGIDCGGFLRSIGCVVANIERTEALFPILYLYRRQEPDTGGPGRHRGGVGVGYAVMPHGVARIETVSPHFSGSVEPESTGLVGGYPGATNAAEVVVGSGVLEARAQGRAVAAPDELGPGRRQLPGVARVSLAADDVLAVIATGGGGFGDPLERPPTTVARDVRDGLVSPASAARQFGVAVDDAGRIDETKTRDLRSALRRARLGHAPTTDGRADAADGWTVIPGDDGVVVRCRRCDGIAPVFDVADPLAALPHRFVDLRAAGPHVGAGRVDDRFHLRETYCPMCGRALAVRRVGSPDAPDREVLDA
jgi:N-methylhydantoinase B